VAASRRKRAGTYGDAWHPDTKEAIEAQVEVSREANEVRRQQRADYLDQCMERAHLVQEAEHEAAAREGMTWKEWRRDQELRDWDDRLYPGMYESITGRKP
jgi:hypothetical protein